MWKLVIACTAVIWYIILLTIGLIGWREACVFSLIIVGIQMTHQNDTLNAFLVIDENVIC